MKDTSADKNIEENVTESTSSIFDRPVEQKKVENSEKKSEFLFLKKNEKETEEKEETETEKKIDDSSIIFNEFCNLYILAEKSIEQRGTGKIYIKQVEHLQKKEEKVVNTEKEDKKDEENKESDNENKNEVNESEKIEEKSENEGEKLHLNKLTMVREKIGLLGCNHYIIGALHKHSSPRTFIFTSLNDNTLLGDEKKATFLVKFNTEEIAESFEKIYNESKDHNLKILNKK